MGRVSPEYKKMWISKNPDKFNSYKSRRNERNKERYDTDPVYRLQVIIKNTVRRSLKNVNGSKTCRTIDILGCTYKELREYLELQMEGKYTWSDHGKYPDGFDIDHIIPISAAETIDEVIQLSHYTNMQVLNSRINRDVKGNRLDFNLE